MRVKYPLLLSDFSESCNFLDTCSKNTRILNFIKIRQVGVQLSDRRRAGGKAGRQAGRCTKDRRTDTETLRS